MPLPNNLRIKHEKDFERIFKTGLAFKHPLFLLKFLKNKLSYCRVAISVPVSLSKKAVVRNKIKRLFWTALEDIFMHYSLANETDFSGIDLVIVVSPVALEKNIDQITKSLEEIFIKANIVKS